MNRREFIQIIGGGVIGRNVRGIAAQVAVMLAAPLSFAQPVVVRSGGFFPIDPNT